MEITSLFVIKSLNVFLYNYRYLRKVFFRIGFKGGFGNVWKALMDVPEVIANKIIILPLNISNYSSTNLEYNNHLIEFEIIFI